MSTAITRPHAAGTEPAVEVSGLTISYRRRAEARRVLTDVAFSIRPGEAYGLVGESGCGKTTVAMSVMRYLPDNAVVESGSIRLGDEDVLALQGDALRRMRGNRMAMVYQDPASALNPAMRVGDQVAEVYRLHLELGTGDAADAAREMLERVQISDAARVMRRYPHELSGGQQQRVMIAMALATNPELLVLDEPTTGLDATVEAEVLDLVAKLRRDFGASVLFISHNLGIVARMCERVGVLYAGRLVEEGPAQELFSSPRHPYTLGLLRCVPRLGMRKDSRRLDPIPGALPALGESPPGCVYADRCPIARERCHTEPPSLRPVEPGRAARCHFASEVADISPSLDAAPAPVLRPIDEPLLRVEELTKHYRSGSAEVQAVAGVSLEIRRGEILGLVGESGSGKTTLARAVVGLTQPSTGAIRFGDGDIAHRQRDRSLQRAIQMVFQNPDSALNPRHSVRRILTRAIKRLTALSKRERESELLALAERVKLSPAHLEVGPRALSGGLKQRVAIARALAGRPALVVCDEPVSALDVSVQAAILNLLVDLQASAQLSYLFISHDLAIVRYLADRIAVMHLGELVEIGSADAVFTPPHHPYTEALASAIPTLGLERPRKRIRLSGPMPSPSDPPSGCRFHTRCPRYLGDVCSTTRPPWQDDGDGHRYRCHIPPDALGELQDDGGGTAPVT